nr:ATPase family AAA domain-containing protein 1-A [Tanacetum cinerariifolium]
MTLEAYNNHHNLGINIKIYGKNQRTKKRRISPNKIQSAQVDSLLGVGGFEHEATRRMRNAFMAAWDELRSKDSQRILIFGATYRPFDLDDAIIR